MQESGNNLEKEVEKIYTPLSVAKEEIWRRWNDKELKKKVEDFLGGDIPEVFRKEPMAVLARHIASPNFEFFRFLDFAKILNINPVCLEYSADQFKSENRDKYCLGKLFFCDGVGKKMGEKINATKVIDFDSSEGKKFKDMTTLNGENFISFHHQLLSGSVHNYKKLISDESNWVKNNGEVSEIFYENFLALFICHGIIFENFLRVGKEKFFTETVVVPSFNKIKKIFGVSPLIVPLMPIDSEDDLHWRCYPGEVKKLLV